MTTLDKESVSPEEPGIIQEITDNVVVDQEAQYKPGTTARRDVHSKSHGTINNASFTTLTSIPAEARVGIFANHGLYEAVVRFSNGSPGVGSDAQPNVRGIAIKVRPVKGKKLLAGDEDANCIDFLMANHPTSFHRFVQDYVEIQDIMKDGNIPKLLKRFPVEGLLLLRAVLKLVKNPLTIAYYSQTPYMLGDRAVKYALVPQQKSCFFALPNFRDPDFLRHAAESWLNRRSAKFTLCVQFQEEGDPIENPGIRWKGPLIPVANLVLPQIHGELTENGGEALTYNPWRTLAQHRPLGWVNRVRQAVYAADFAWRTAKNAAREVGQPAAAPARCPFGYGNKKD